MYIARELKKKNSPFSDSMVACIVDVLIGDLKVEHRIITASVPEYHGEDTGDFCSFLTINPGAWCLSLHFPRPREWAILLHLEDMK